MKDMQREKFIAEIKHYEDAIKKTTSKYLIKDYRKKVIKMKLELKEYDRYHNGCRSNIT